MEVWVGKTTTGKETCSALIAVMLDKTAALPMLGGSPLASPAPPLVQAVSQRGTSED